jgi:cell wall-associated NlpC family hydrolase
MPWPAHYVGVPFRKGGRSHAGCDCWGLVRLVLLEERGIELSRRGDLSGGRLAELISGSLPQDMIQEWLPVEPAQASELDLVTMTGDPFHVGILTPERWLLHVEEATGDAVIVPLSHPTIRDRAIAAYRHRALANDTP